MANDPTYPKNRIAMRQDGSMAIPAGVVINFEGGTGLHIQDVDVTATLQTLDQAQKSQSGNRPGRRKAVAVAGVASVAGGGVLAWQNPEAGAIFITRILLDVTVVSAGAANLVIGTTAVSAATSSNNLIDTLDVHSAIGTFDNVDNKGANGKAHQKLPVGDWITITGSAATTGLVGTLYIEYFLA